MMDVRAIIGIPLLLALAGQVHADSARKYCLEQFPADYYSKEDHALYIKECIDGLQDPVAEEVPVEEVPQGDIDRVVSDQAEAGVEEIAQD